MTEVVHWTGFFIAFLALAGWSVFLVMFTRAQLPSANALGILQKVDQAMDERIKRLLTSIEAKRRPAVQSVPSQPNAAQEELRNIFGGNPVAPIGEQPDSEDDRLEIIS